MKRFLCAFTFTASIIATTFSFAQEKDLNRVLAVVNDHIITTADTDMRFNFMLSQMQKDFPESQHRALKNRALNDLINESLYRQYAEKNGVTVTPQEVELSLAQLERNNKMPAGSLTSRNDATANSLKNKLVADLLWQKIIGQRIQPRVNIGNEEIDLLIDSMLAGNMVQEYEVSHIFLATKGDENSVEETANKLYRDITQGVDFKSVAKVYSEDSFADQGGYMGWFSESELAPVIASSVNNLSVGDVHKPKVSSAGWHIVRLENKRESKRVRTKPIKEVNLLRLTASKTNDQKANKKLKKQLDKWRRNVDNVSDMKDLINDKNETKGFAGSGDLGWIRYDDLPSDIASTVKKLDEGDMSKVVENDTNFTIVYVAASRDKIPEELEKFRERLKGRLTNSRVELSARQFLRNLRRQAYIDVRL